MDVKSIRKQLGYTQTDFAKAVGINQNLISKLERFLIKPTPRMRQKLKVFCSNKNIDFAEFTHSDIAQHITAILSR